MRWEGGNFSSVEGQLVNARRAKRGGKESTLPPVVIGYFNFIRLLRRPSPLTPPRSAKLLAWAMGRDQPSFPRGLYGSRGQDGEVDDWRSVGHFRTM